MTDLPEVWKQIGAKEKSSVRRLGDEIGYGRMMQLAKECWRELLEKDGMAGGEFAYGPCVAMLVPCGCGKQDEDDYCDWCCGTGMVTERVSQAKLETDPRGKRGTG